MDMTTVRFSLVTCPFCDMCFCGSPACSLPDQALHEYNYCQALHKYNYYQALHEYNYYQALHEYKYYCSPLRSLPDQALHEYNYYLDTHCLRIQTSNMKNMNTRWVL